MKHGNSWSWLITKFNTFFFVKAGSPRSRGPQKHRAMFWNVNSTRREGTPLSDVYSNISQVHYNVIWALRVQLCGTPHPHPSLQGYQGAICYCFCFLVGFFVFVFLPFELVPTIAIGGCHWIQICKAHSQLWVGKFASSAISLRQRNLGHIRPLWSCVCFLRISVLLLSLYSSLLSKGLRKPVLKMKYYLCCSIQVYC